MSGLLVTLPLHLACQLINPDNLGNGNVTFVEDTTTFTQASSLPLGYTAFLDAGVAYKYYENRLTWNDARKQCIAEGGNLAVIDSFRKIEYVMSVKDRSATIHTGIHRLFNNVEWINVKTGQALGFVPWKSDVSLAAGSGESVALWYDGSGLSPWKFTTVLPSVCEISIHESYRNKAQICQKNENNGPSTKSPERLIDVRISSSNLTTISLS